MEKPKTIHRNALVSQISTKTNLDIKTINLALDSLQESILENLNNNLNTKINSFVSFEEINVAPRKGVNPETGEKIVIPAKRRMNVKVSEKFQEKIIQSQDSEK